MLKLPQLITDLYTAGSVRKNFRVTFPDGERADLTNADIVQESVTLTEAVTSESVFRFGGCERSMIEFKAVGVENIRGARIQCYMEVDTSSLTAAQISSIQSLLSNPGFGYVGAIVLAQDSDIGWGFYRIPYFGGWVESCPRDQTSREHRKITAYSEDPTRISSVERVRLSTYIPGLYYTQNNADAYAAVNLGELIPELRDSWEYAKNANTNAFYTWAEIQALGAADSASFSVTSGGHTYTLSVSGTFALVDFSDKYGGTFGMYLTRLQYADLSGWDTDEAWSWVQQKFSDAGADMPTVAAHTRLPRTYLQPHLGYDQLDQYGDYDHAPIYWLPDFGCPFYLHVQRTPAQKANAFVRLMWDLTVTFAVDGATQDTETFFPLADLTATVGAYATQTKFPNAITFDIAATDEYESGGVKAYSYSDSYDVLSLISGALEMRGRQIRVGRTGVPDVITLKNSSPKDVAADHVESIFWEDTEIESVGQVPYKLLPYRGSSELISSTVYVDGGGSSIYNLLDNYMMTNFPNSGFYAADFVAALQPAEFVPYEAKIHNMPWLQPGDPVKLYTGDPDTPTLTSFILHQTIRGVQDLVQEIGANGGTTIFEGNSYGKPVAMIYGKTTGSGSVAAGGGGGGGGTTEEDGSADISDNYGAAARKKLYKVGNICFFFYQSTSRVWAANNNICTLPAGFRPSDDTIYAPATNNANAANIAIGTNGTVTINQITTQSGNSRIYINCWFHV